MSKIRDRFGLEVFQQFFEVIVERCCVAGLVWGQELYFDGTRVRANADIDQQVPRFTRKPNSICKPCLAVNRRGMFRQVAEAYGQRMTANGG